MRASWCNGMQLLQCICTEPETFTVTALLPASTAIGEASSIADLDCMAIMRGRGPGDWLLLFTETSRSV